MASETKVGLLVGLGFIVCFAVILANRGRGEQISAQLPYSLLAPPPQSVAPADRASTGPAENQRFTEQRALASPIAPLQNPPTDASRLTDRSNRQAAQRSAIGVPADSDMVGQSIAGLRRSNDVASRLQSERVRIDPQRTLQPALDGYGDPRPIEPSSQRVVSGDSAVPVEHLTDRLTQRLTPVDRQRPASSAHTETRRLQALVDRSASSPARPPSKKTGVPVRAVSGKKYTVVSGDNLYRIARKHYGDSSRELVRGIFEANRTVLTNENEVHIGDVLFLPHVERKRKSAGPARASIAKPQRDTRKDSSAKPARRRGDASPFRWYQVEAHDRYSTIAAAQLGDSRRWKELFELNRDIFPDPDRIRAGVRIRIPTIEVAAARGGRR